MFPPTPWGWSQNTTFLIIRMDRFEGKNRWEVFTGNLTRQQKPLLMSFTSWDTGEDLSPCTGTSRRFNTRVFLMSGIALHQNCQLNSQCYLPVFNPNSHWLTTSVFSHKRLPTPTGAGLKEHLQGHHQSCQFISTAVETLPQTWGYTLPIQRIGNSSFPSSHHLSGFLWRYQNETAQNQLQSSRNRPFSGSTL